MEEQTKECINWGKCDSDSVTGWIDYFVNIWEFETNKICSKGSINICHSFYAQNLKQIRKNSKNCPKT